MTQHNNMIRLQHMLDHAKEAEALIAGKGRAELQHDRVLELALIRLVEIVGEASVKVSSETQAKHPSIPWPQVIGMRNRLRQVNQMLEFVKLRARIQFDSQTCTTEEIL